MELVSKLALNVILALDFIKKKKKLKTIYLDCTRKVD